MRYTIEHLKTMTDKEFVLSVLAERRGKCTNYCSPLSVRLKRTISTLKQENFGTQIMEKKPKIEKKPTLMKYEKPVVVDLNPESAAGINGMTCNPNGSAPYYPDQQF